MTTRNTPVGAPGAADPPKGPNRFGVVPTPHRLDVDPDYTGRGVTIAFVDSGFSAHPDLTEPVNRILAYVDVDNPGATLDAGAEPDPSAWHGTQTSVVAAGNGTLSEGAYRGIARDANVVLVKVGAVRVSDDDIARGLEWVVENRDRYGIRVVNVSCGGDEHIPVAESVADRAAEKAAAAGIVVVAAAGNSGAGPDHRPMPPANAPSVITVGGYDDKNRPGGDVDLYPSSYGRTADGLLKPEVIAPAVWVAAPILPDTPSAERAEALSKLASAPTGALPEIAREEAGEAGLPEEVAGEHPKLIRHLAEEKLVENKIVAAHYQHVDGTSFAAPIVSSVVAQMLEANPALTPAAVKYILLSTAERLRDEPVLRQGYGVVNPRRAVRMAREAHGETHAVAARPPWVEAGRLVFLFLDETASRVSVAGEFNGWEPGRTPLARDDGGTWRVELDVPAVGPFRYKFVVDDDWIEDPANWLKETDERGQIVSVLYVS